MPFRLTIQAFADDAGALPDLLVDAPESMRNAAPMPVNNLDKRLVEWGLR